MLCWALAPFLTLPCHWRELKKARNGAVAGAQKYKGANSRHFPELNFA